MDKRCITAAGAPPAVGPYSHAVEAGGFLYVSGQLAMAADDSGPIVGTAAEEARIALLNLKTVLDASGSSLEKVVKATIFLTDMGGFGAVNEVYAEFFKANPPARSCVQVAALPKGLHVEIEAVALLK